MTSNKTCMTTMMLAVNKVNPCREIRDMIKEYLFFDIRTIIYANYLSDKRFKLFKMLSTGRFDSDVVDDGDDSMVGYFAFWTTIPSNDDNSEDEPQFQSFFCSMCGNYYTPPTNMDITLFKNRSLQDRLFCTCDDDTPM